LEINEYYKTEKGLDFEIKKRQIPGIKFGFDCIWVEEPGKLERTRRRNATEIQA